MFSIKGNQILFGDCSIEIPAQLVGKEYEKIFGTATCNLDILKGYVLSKFAKSIQVQLSDRVQSGYAIENIEVGDIVYLREQLDPVSETIFYLVSKNKLELPLNWINIKYKDGLIFRVCPFTFRYRIV